MDKYTYSLKVEKIQKLVRQEEYVQAAKIADTMEWGQERNVRLLTAVAEAYEKTGQFPKAIDVLLTAYERSSVGKRIMYKLTELALAAGEIGDAETFYRKYLEEAPDENNRFILRYKIAEAKGEGLDKRITILETYKKYEFEEEWACRLAELYAEAGEEKKCVALCDEIILWFGVGTYVDRAMELKEKFQPLTDAQREHRENREYYEARVKAIANEMAEVVAQKTASLEPEPEEEEPESQASEEADEDDLPVIAISDEVAATSLAGAPDLILAPEPDLPVIPEMANDDLPMVPHAEETSFAETAEDMIPEAAEANVIPEAVEANVTAAESVLPKAESVLPEEPVPGAESVLPKAEDIVAGPGSILPEPENVLPKAAAGTVPKPDKVLKAAEADEALRNEIAEAVLQEKIEIPAAPEYIPEEDISGGEPLEDDEYDAPSEGVIPEFVGEKLSKIGAFLHNTVLRRPGASEAPEDFEDDDDDREPVRRRSYRRKPAEDYFPEEEELEIQKPAGKPAVSAEPEEDIVPEPKAEPARKYTGLKPEFEAFIPGGRTAGRNAGQDIRETAGKIPEPEVRVPEPAEVKAEIPVPVKPEAEIPEAVKVEEEAAEPVRAEVEIPEPEIRMPEPAQPELKMPERPEPKETVVPELEMPEADTAGSEEMKPADVIRETAALMGMAEVLSEAESADADQPAAIPVPEPEPEPAKQLPEPEPEEDLPIPEERVDLPGKPAAASSALPEPAIPPEENGEMEAQDLEDAINAALEAEKNRVRGGRYRTVGSEDREHMGNTRNLKDILRRTIGGVVGDSNNLEPTKEIILPSEFKVRPEEMNQEADMPDMNDRKDTSAEALTQNEPEKVPEGIIDPETLDSVLNMGTEPLKAKTPESPEIAPAPLEEDPGVIPVLSYEETERAAWENHAARRIQEPDPLDSREMERCLFVRVEEGEDAVGKAVAALEGFYRSRQMEVGSIAKIAAERLNQRGLVRSLPQLTNKDLIIDKAEGLSADTIRELLRVLRHLDTDKVFVVMDRPEELERLKQRIRSQISAASSDEAEAAEKQEEDVRTDPPVREQAEQKRPVRKVRQISFDHMDPKQELSEREFVRYADYFAHELECVIDDSGFDALEDEIDAIRQEGGQLLAGEVEDIIEDAAEHASRPSISRIFGSKYDKDGFLILRGRDFR